MDKEVKWSNEVNEVEAVNSNDHIPFQKLEEKAKKAEEAHAAEEKLRKELEVLNSKLLAEKTALLESLAGEKGSLSEFQEKTAKLQAQKNDLDNQLRVSIQHKNTITNYAFSIHKKWKRAVDGPLFHCLIWPFHCEATVNCINGVNNVVESTNIT